MKLRGEQWFLNYPIPKDIQGEYLTEGGSPRDHIVKRTGASGLNDANRIKYGLIEQLEREFAKKRREASGELPADLRMAKQLSAELEIAGSDHRKTETLQEVISDQAGRIYHEGGKTNEALARARAFTSIAMGNQTVMDTFDEWMEHSTLPDRTRSKYRTAVQEFASFLGGLALVTQMTRDNAINYVDWLNKEAKSLRTNKIIPLSYNTKRDRVLALSAFWNLWLSRRGKAVEQINPWSRLTVTEKPTPSTMKWDNLGNTGRPQRREAFEDEALICILDAPGPKIGGNIRYGKPLLMEVFALALLTGARPDELCSLTLADVKAKDGGYWLNFDETKTKDDRQIPVVHPTAVAVIQRRIGKRIGSAEQLFPELRPKGKGVNLYELLGRALGRHLDRAVGLDN